MQSIFFRLFQFVTFVFLATFYLIPAHAEFLGVFGGLSAESLSEGIGTRDQHGYSPSIGYTGISTRASFQLYPAEIFHGPFIVEGAIIGHSLHCTDGFVSMNQYTSGDLNYLDAQAGLGAGLDLYIFPSMGVQVQGVGGVEIGLLGNRYLKGIDTKTRALLSHTGFYATGRASLALIPLIHLGVEATYHAGWTRYSGLENTEYQGVQGGVFAGLVF